MFTGLNAFPLTPLHDGELDERAFSHIMQMLALSHIDAITVLGSTGSAPYLTPDERARVAELGVAHAGNIPVAVGVSALSTREVLRNVRSAERAGAEALLLAPMSYQPLRDTEVFELYRAVHDATELPIIAYDNPTTTHFTFSLELYAALSELERLASIKIPGVPNEPAAAASRVAQIRNAIAPGVTIGVSGDQLARAGLDAGCDAWFSVLAGTAPELALRVMRGGAEAITLEPLWDLFTEFGGSLRVVSAIAEHLGFVGPHSLPLPVRGLEPMRRERAISAFTELA